MAHPKRKHSCSRSRKRRTHQKCSFPLLVECKQCKRKKPAHMICPFCGYYQDREVIEILPKEKKQKR
ncbi:MAG: 50S ribosomal protein L32 [Candidatus Omnitrophica bacterium]|jgi:large subunit ribosomal protein L32|nr:50S ribosomal protein L32 [Candidatus Omnitrophota bacterium]